MHICITCTIRYTGKISTIFFQTGAGGGAQYSDPSECHQQEAIERDWRQNSLHTLLFRGQHPGRRKRYQSLRLLESSFWWNPKEAKG